MTALYLLEPERPVPRGRRSPASGRSRSFGPGRGASASAGRRRVEADATAILGTHVEGFHESDVPPVRPVSAIEGPAVVAASWFAPTGDRVARPAPGRPPADASGRHRRLGRPRGRALGWAARAGRRDRDPGAAPFGALRPGHRPRAVSAGGLRRFPVAPSTGVPKEASSWATRPRGRAGAPRSSPASCSTCARAGRPPGGRRGTKRHPARGTALRRTGNARLLGRVRPRVRLRPRVPGPRRNRGQRVPRLRQQDATTGSWATASWDTG